MRGEFKKVDPTSYAVASHFDASVRKRNAIRHTRVFVRDSRRTKRERLKQPSYRIFVNSRSIVSHQLKLSIYRERSGKLSSSRFLSVDGIDEISKERKREREKERRREDRWAEGFAELRCFVAARFRNIPRVTLFREGSAGIDSTRRPRGQWSPEPDPPAGPDRRPP